MAREPNLIMLDEPAGGMTPGETDDMAGRIERVAADGPTVLLIEHKMGMVMSLCRRIAVLNFGRKIAEGTPAESSATVPRRRRISARGRSMLEVTGLRIAYDRVVAVHGLDLRVGEGEVVAIVGPNGAGKTSTMMAISGVVAHEAGAIRFRGEDISRTPSHDIYRRGIVQVPEGRMIFSELTVRDNLLLGAHAHGASESGNPELEVVFGLFPVLRERLHQRADTLSGGQLQMLAIARGLMGKPELFMLDEPSLGLAPLVAEEVFGMITTLNRARDDDPSGRAERAQGARDIRPCLPAGGRPARRDRHGGRPSRERSHHGVVPRESLALRHRVHAGPAQVRHGGER